MSVKFCDWSVILYLSSKWLYYKQPILSHWSVPGKSLPKYIRVQDYKYLPPSQSIIIFRSSLYEVLDHFYNVSSLNSFNQMTAENLAIVLGPTLSWSQGKVKRDNIAMVMFQQNSVIEFLIRNCQEIKKIKEMRWSKFQCYLNWDIQWILELSLRLSRLGGGMNNVLTLKSLWKL